MHHIAALNRRIRAIKALAPDWDGGMPALGCPEIHGIAWRAEWAGVALVIARQKLGFLNGCAAIGLPSLRWRYRAYARDRRMARTHLRGAAKRIQECEVAAGLVPVLEDVA